ncbi:MULTISPECIES: hypothetical protein [unclassified Microbulbifer]|uniref:hypothetical protein n=1 Tax=unclassified Microbulbifer TaxID=2619833 RepID=UPI0027E44C27|nr:MULTISPECIES: hypothetical protein [unclassified Microbulbifer]
MTEPKKPKTLSQEEKQYTVLPNEVDPRSSPSQAMVAALKAREITRKARQEIGGKTR